MHRTVTILLLLLTFTAGTAAAAELAAIERTMRAAAGYQASFTQSFTPKGFRNAQVEKGEVVFGPPPAMRWTYTAPEKKLFTFDGSTSWLYLPLEKQATSHRLTEREKSELPFLFLSDPATLARAYTVVERKEGGTVRTSLSARDTSGLIRDIVITSSSRDHLVRRLEYTDREGNRTVFEFTSYRRMKPAADAFVFVPPAGVEVIRN
jgi:chaperone LolA